jgi:hypothetical protein
MRKCEVAYLGRGELDAETDSAERLSIQSAISSCDIRNGGGDQVSNVSDSSRPAAARGNVGQDPVNNPTYVAVYLSPAAFTQVALELADYSATPVEVSRGSGSWDRNVSGVSGKSCRLLNPARPSSGLCL